MYLYFDKNGVLQEVINDKKIRSASDGANRILAYIEGDLEIDEINVVIKRADGSLSNEVSILNNKIYASIPYDKQRDLKFFKDFAEYQFYYYDLTFNDLQYSGLAYATITIYADGKAYAQGMVTFNIEKSVIKTDNLITQSQYQYLLLSYASRTLNEQIGSDLDSLITEKVDSHQYSQFDERFSLYKNQVDALIKLQNEAIDTFKQSVDIRFGLYVNSVDKKIANQNTTIKELGQLHPSGTDTSTNILSYTSSKGIYVATDNGHWYYWNASENKYVDGGVYQAIEVPIEVTEAVNNVNGLLYGEIILDRVEYANNAYRDSEDNLIATYYASKSALSQANKEIANLKEVLYGYVLDSTDVEIEKDIPYTTTIGSNTYNLVDNAYGLIKEVRGNTIKSENLLILEDKAETTTNGVTYSIKDGVITLNGTATDYTTLNIGSISGIKLNDIFTVKTFNSSVYFQYAFYNNDTWLITSNKFRDNATIQVSNENANKIELLVFVSSGETINNSIANPMIVRGSTAPTEFSKGFDGFKSVTHNGLNIVGENLLNIADKTTINVTSDSDRLELNLKSGTQYTCWLKFKVNNYSNTDDKIYSNVAGGVSSVTADIVESEKITVSVGNTYLLKFTFTTPSTFNKFEWRLLRNTSFGGLQINADILEIGVFKGSIDTFKPFRETTILNNFGEPIFLRGVGTAKDKLVITKNEDNEFYTATSVSNTGYIRLGSLKWSLINDGVYNIFLSSAITDIKAYNENVIPNLLTKGNYTLINTLTGANFKSNDYDKKYTIRAYQHDIMVQDASYTDATSFRNAINDLWMVYELATPTSKVISSTLTDSDVMPLLELGGTVEIVGEDGELGSTVVEMVYRLSNTGV